MTRAWVCPLGHVTHDAGFAMVRTRSNPQRRFAQKGEPLLLEVIRCPERIAARTTCGARARLQEPAPRMPGREPT